MDVLSREVRFNAEKKMSIGEIKEITDLSDKEIEKIRRQMEN
jgi:hypothetical protein